MFKKVAGLLLVCAVFFTPLAIADMAEDVAKAEKYLQAEDYKKAFKSYRALAKQGSFKSQFVLAGLYADGNGTKQDAIEGYAWSVLAAESKNAEYISYSEQLLAGIEDKDKASYKAEKLRDKYGAQAQFERAQRTAMRNASRTKCTGSRLSCGSNTQVYTTPIGDEGAITPGAIATEGGN